jgi:hypothetical protein
MKIFGIYQANGGLMGEISYIFRKLVLKHNCSLCKVTHRGLMVKPDWKDYIKTLNIYFELLHINEQPAEMYVYTRGHTPCVIANIDGNYVILMDSEMIDGCNGSVEKFSTLLDKSLKDL